MLQVIVIQTRWNTKRLTKEFYKQKSRGSSCDPALSVHDNVDHHQDNTRDQHVNTFILIGLQLVVMMLRAQWPQVIIAQFFHFVADKKKEHKKTKAFYDWATTGIPVINHPSIITSRWRSQR